MKNIFHMTLVISSTAIAAGLMGCKPVETVMSRFSEAVPTGHTMQFSFVMDGPQLKVESPSEGSAIELESVEKVFGRQTGILHGYSVTDWDFVLPLSARDPINRRIAAGERGDLTGSGQRNGRGSGDKGKQGQRDQGKQDDTKQEKADPSPGQMSLADEESTDTGGEEETAPADNHPNLEKGFFPRYVFQKASFKETAADGSRALYTCQATDQVGRAILAPVPLACEKETLQPQTDDNKPAEEELQADSSTEQKQESKSDPTQDSKASSATDDKQDIKEDRQGDAKKQN